MIQREGLWWQNCTLQPLHEEAQWRTWCLLRWGSLLNTLSCFFQDCVEWKHNLVGGTFPLPKQRVHWIKCSILPIYPWNEATHTFHWLTAQALTTMGKALWWSPRAQRHIQRELYSWRSHFGVVGETYIHNHIQDLPTWCELSAMSPEDLRRYNSAEGARKCFHVELTLGLGFGFARWRRRKVLGRGHFPSVRGCKGIPRFGWHEWGVRESWKMKLERLPGVILSEVLSSMKEDLAPIWRVLGWRWTCYAGKYDEGSVLHRLAAEWRGLGLMAGAGNKKLLWKGT